MYTPLADARGSERSQAPEQSHDRKGVVFPAHK